MKNINMKMKLVIMYLGVILIGLIVLFGATQFVKNVQNDTYQRFETYLKAGQDEDHTAGLQEIKAEMQKNVKSSQLKFIIITVIIILLISAVVEYIMIDLNRGLKKSIMYAKNLAEGDFSREADGKYQSRKDEIGDLAKAMNLISVNMKQLIEAVRGEANNLDQVVTGTKQNLSGVGSDIEEVSATTQELAASMEETAAVCHRHLRMPRW